MIIKINGVISSFPISAKFGSIDAVHLSAHTGLDLVMPTGTAILSPIDGVISRISDFGNASLGKAVYVKMQDGRELVFGHLSKINVRNGDTVHFGQKIAESGNTGFSTGDHLHLALKDINGSFVDPKPFEKIFQTFDPQSGIIHAKVPTVFDMINPFSKTEIANPFKEVMEFFQPIRDFFAWCGGVVHNIKAEGFWNWVDHRLMLTFKFILSGILHMNDLLFLMPAILFMIAYFVVGKNRTTKWIIPCWFAYFVTEIISGILKTVH